MKNFLYYAWSKRAKWWARRDLGFLLVGRFLIRLEYRSAGIMARLARGLAPRNITADNLTKAANPFIEYELGRLQLKSAPIPTTIRESYSQCNEDIIVESLLRAKFAVTGRSMSSVRYLEIGGNHPVQTSSTYLFFRAWGARGYIVEANAALAERLRDVRPGDEVIQTAVSDLFDDTVSLHIHELDELSSLSRDSIIDSASAGLRGKIASVETVRNMHINNFFAQYIKEQIDFMSIDIEGLDLRVLQALSPVYRPTVLQVECVSPDLLTKLRATLEPRRYQLAAITDVNVIFVQEQGTQC